MRHSDKHFSERPVWNGTCTTLAEVKCSYHRAKATSFAQRQLKPSCQISGPFFSHVLDWNSYFFSSLHSLYETADASVKFCTGKDDHFITPVHRFAYVFQFASFGLSILLWANKIKNLKTACN